MVDIKTLITAIKQRRCILFLGAGVHYPPPENNSRYSYPAAQRPPLGTQLSHLLADDSLKRLEESNRLIGVGAEEMRQHQQYLNSHRDELQRISWFYEAKHGREALVSCVRDSVNTGKAPSPVVRALAKLGFPVVITTNYDQLFERALEQCGHAAAPKIYQKSKTERTQDWSEESANGACHLLKIHGCVSAPESIVITDVDYIHFVARMLDPEDYKPVPQSIRTKLAQWNTLFIGYSLLDFNLRLLFHTLRWNLDPAVRPPTFSLDLHPDPLISEWYDGQEHLVSFVVQDLWNFVPMLYQEILQQPMEP